MYFLFKVYWAEVKQNMTLSWRWFADVIFLILIQSVSWKTQAFKKETRRLFQKHTVDNFCTFIYPFNIKAKKNFKVNKKLFWGPVFRETLPYRLGTFLNLFKWKCFCYLSPFISKLKDHLKQQLKKYDHHQLSHFHNSNVMVFKSKIVRHLWWIDKEVCFISKKV